MGRHEGKAWVGMRVDIRVDASKALMLEGSGAVKQKDSKD